MFACDAIRLLWPDRARCKGRVGVRSKLLSADQRSPLLRSIDRPSVPEAGKLARLGEREFLKRCCRAWSKHFSFMRGDMARAWIGAAAKRPVLQFGGKL